MMLKTWLLRLRIEWDNKPLIKTLNTRSAKAKWVPAPKVGIVKQRSSRDCYNCDQPGHRAANCKMPKRVNPRQANMVNDDVDMIAIVSDVCAMIFVVNLVGTNHGGWWIDTRATCHVCTDKSMFHSFKPINNGQKLYMGNSATADIKGEGDFVLKMTSEKELKLTNGYAMNGMFKLNVMVVKNEINKINSSAYLIESSNVWHARLGHARQISMMKLSKIRDNEYDMISKREDKIQRERKMRMKKLNQRRSIRARNKKCLDDFVSFMVENELVTVLPRSGTSSEGHNWRKAIKSEIDSILNNHTWELVDLPPGYKPLGYKWISRREKA
ncbi:pol polyprotein [Tanacetum coccineum]